MKESEQLDELVNQLSNDGYSDQEIEEFLEDLSNLTDEELAELNESILNEAPDQSQQMSRKIYMNPEINLSTNDPTKKGNPGVTVRGPYRGSNDTADYTRGGIKESVGSIVKRAAKAWKNTENGYTYGSEKNRKNQMKFLDQYDSAGGSMLAGAAAVAGGAAIGSVPGFEPWFPVGAAIGAGWAAKGLYHGAKAAYYKGKLTKAHLGAAKQEYSRLQRLGESTEEIEQEIALIEAVIEENREITQEILTSAIVDSAANIQDVFERVIKDRISTLVDQRKADLASEMFNPVVESSYQSDLDEKKPVVVSGVKGMKSIPFTKKFKNYQHFLNWSEKDENAGNHAIHHVYNESEEQIDEGKFRNFTNELGKKFGLPDSIAKDKEFETRFGSKPNGLRSGAWRKAKANEANKKVIDKD